MSDKLRCVIAAIATAVDEEGEPDCARSATLARFLLANGCDGLNVLGTTGEATSFSLEQRKRLMTGTGRRACRSTVSWSAPVPPRWPMQSR